MKRKITAITICIILLSLFTACGSEDKESNRVDSNETTTLDITNSDDNISDFNETAYIPVRMEFLTLNNKLIPEGKAYIDAINHAESEEWENTSKIAEFILFAEKVIYFDGNEFMQFSVGNMPDDRKYYSGEYNIESDGKVDLTYNFYCEKDENEELYIDLKNEQGNMENNRKSWSIVEEINNANDYGYVLHASGLINQNDKYPYMSYPHWLAVNQEGDNWENRFIPIEELETELYSKGDFMVAKQKGYSFEVNVSKKEFTLKYDDSNIDPDNSELRKMTMKFNSDNTWESDYHDLEYSGAWKLMYDNLLVIYPPENNKKYSENNITLLYLDFENEEIYVPTHIRCDDIVEFAEKYKENM